MKRWNIISTISHWFSESWEREWAGIIKNWSYPGENFRWTETFVFVERCKVCGKVRAFYSNSSNRQISVDLDYLILSSGNQVPYRVGKHTKIE